MSLPASHAYKSSSPGMFASQLVTCRKLCSFDKLMSPLIEASKYKVINTIPNLSLAQALLLRVSIAATSMGNVACCWVQCMAWLRGFSPDMYVKA